MNFDRRAPIAALALVTASASAPAVLADARDTYYERAVMVAADGHCRLFSPELSSALAAAEAQARGAALRSGDTSEDLDQVEQRARGRAYGAECNSADITTAAARVRQGFAGYSALRKMSYPGDTAAWLAVRQAPMRTPVWKLSQTTRFGGAGAVLGLAGRDGPSVMLTVASFPDDARPYTARLVLRDRGVAPEPFLNAIRAGSGPLPLTSRMPPRPATTAFLPEARSGADASLLPTGARSGVAFRFPKGAAESLAALDPREAVAVDFVFAGAGGGDQVRTAYFEVGDFAAGRAFLTAAQR